MSLLLPLLFGALAVPAHAAAVYKCTGDKGRVVYQDTECAPGADLGSVVIEPPPRAKALPPAPPTKAATNPARVAVGTVTFPGDAKQRKFLHPGMSEAEVVQKVGRPDLEDKGNAKTGPRWTYLPATGDPTTQTTLTFAGGKLAYVERKAVR